MSERLKKTPAWHKVFGVIETLALAACATGEKIGLVMPTPEGTKTTPTETVPPITLPSTEISPSPGAGETIVITEQRYMSQQEALAVDPLVESKFRAFQEEIKVNNPSATFAAWGALATAQTGETYFTPFFEVYSNGNLVSEYVNIGKIDGSIATIELKPGEVEGPDGKIYVSLSQTVNTDTNELLETPWPYIWIPYSRTEYNALPDDQKDKVPVYFSAIPGIVPQNEAPVYGGAKTENIRMIIATPTPEAPEIIFVPEGFQISELGLLQNPETGKDVITLNPEADWERVREEIIGGLWQANMDWAKFTGESSDALNYSTKEEFIKVAEEGKVLKIRIPVRDNLIWDKLDPVKMGRNYQALYGYRTEVAQLKKVEVRLDTIQVQILDANAFKEYLDGKDWLAPDQEAIGQWYLPSDQGNGALHFGVNEEGQLVISVGSYFMGDTLTTGNEFEIGRFGSELHEKYPTYFRSDGLGVDADGAVSYFFASMTVWLNHLPDGVNARLTKDGTEYKYLRVFRAQDVLGIPDMTGWYLNPPVFVFAK